MNWTEGDGPDTAGLDWVDRTSWDIAVAIAGKLQGGSNEAKAEKLC